MQEQVIWRRELQTEWYYLPQWKELLHLINKDLQSRL